MARSCGIRIGPRRFELAVLDGSPKRHKISAYHVGEFSAEDAAAFAEGDVAGVAATLKEAAKSHRIPYENVSVVVATDHAAFRRLTVPFSDRQKIDQVLKFEIESELPHLDIDGVVVDYHVMNENDGGAELLVSAAPKDDLQRVIAACDRAGIEPLEIEFEASAMVNAAFAADMCHIDDAQLLVHIGEHSTCVAVVAGAEIREFRVIHLGAMSHLVKELDMGDGVEVDLDADAPDEAAGAVEMERRMEQAIKRIRRELGRTISAARTPQTIEAIYVCGMEMPGLIGSEVLGVPVYVLDCFDEDSGQPADGFGQLVAAYGSAFRQLGGGVMKPSLRREELRYTGTWERLEFPVAFAVLLLAALLLLVYIAQGAQLQRLKKGALYQLRSANLHAVGDPDKARLVPLMVPVPEELGKRAAKYRDIKTMAELEDLNDPVQELREIVAWMKKENKKVSDGAGVTQEYPLPPSAFSAMTLVLGKLGSNDAWRPSLRGLQASYEKDNRKGRQEHVRIYLDATFFAKDTVEATRHINEFARSLRNEVWCLEVETAQTTPLKTDNGLSFKKFVVRVDPKLFHESTNQTQ